MTIVYQHSMRHWRDDDNKMDLSALQKLPGMTRKCCKCHEMQGHPHSLGKGVKRDLGRKWHLSKDLQDEECR